MRFHYSFLLPLLLTFIQPSFSQETATAYPIIPNPLLRNDAFFSKTWYQYFDGTPVDYKNVLSLVSSIPDNDDLVKQERGWRITTYILSGLCVASVGVLATYQLADLPYSGIAIPICIGSAGFSLLSGVLTGQIANNKLQRSIDNYNLYIMSIPFKYMHEPSAEGF